jgi:hypothetical protein
MRITKRLLDELAAEYAGKEKDPSIRIATTDGRCSPYNYRLVRNGERGGIIGITEPMTARQMFDFLRGALT